MYLETIGTISALKRISKKIVRVYESEPLLPKRWPPAANHSVERLAQRLAEQWLQHEVRRAAENDTAID